MYRVSTVILGSYPNRIEPAPTASGLMFHKFGEKLGFAPFPWDLPK